jgi:UDP-GlcNAc:undecaprenyl-phosphate/decaprenyl-phosphate GlcNAc-1-phosphate transferase
VWSSPQRQACVLPDEARLIGAALLSLTAVWLLAPLALRVAVRTGFYDHPVGYKAHASPTPYLGGAAVLAGFFLAAIVFDHGSSRFWPILACALGLAVLGTLDDRFAIRPRYRILAEATAAAILWHYGLGWSFLDSRFEELVLTTIWIVGFTNAFSVMDNMDGAASTVVAACAAGLALNAAVGGDMELAAFSLALCGACLGFLRYNLRAGAPARIFLGDGGSIPIGFVAAAAAMNMPVDEPLGWPALLVSGLLLGVPVLDTSLVVVSRTRRSISIATGGRDHLTHRLCAKLGSTRTTVAALALVQFGLSLVAIAAGQVGRTTIIVAAMASLVFGALIIAVLESPEWAPMPEPQGGPDRQRADWGQPRSTPSPRHPAKAPAPALSSTSGPAPVHNGHGSYMRIPPDQP